MGRNEPPPVFGDSPKYQIPNSGGALELFASMGVSSPALTGVSTILFQYLACKKLVSTERAESLLVNERKVNYVLLIFPFSVG